MSSCRRSSWWICPTMATSFQRVLWRQSATCWTSWMGFWMAASRWVCAGAEKIQQQSVLQVKCQCVCFQCQGGNGGLQRVRRLIYDVKVTLTVSPSTSRPVSCLSLWPLTSLSSTRPADLQPGSAARLLLGWFPDHRHRRPLLPQL